MTGDNAALSGGAIDMYLKHREIFDHVVFYEDIIAEPERITQGLFDTLGIKGEDSVKTALKALEKHSQVRHWG